MAVSAEKIFKSEMKLNRELEIKIESWTWRIGTPLQIHLERLATETLILIFELDFQVSRDGHLKTSRISNPAIYINRYH